MKKTGVYFLRGDFIYVGSTNDLERRLKEHRQGKTKTTKELAEWELARFLECPSLEDARALERKIKKSGHYERWLKG